MAARNLPPERPTRTADALVGGGTMAEIIRHKDWSRTPLGPIDRWPQSLGTAVEICLHCRFLVIFWVGSWVFQPDPGCAGRGGWSVLRGGRDDDVGAHTAGARRTRQVCQLCSFS